MTNKKTPARPSTRTVRAGDLRQIRGGAQSVAAIVKANGNS